jgi:decaprenyl-phosphate phosphoribosyltransferase
LKEHGSRTIVGNQIRAYISGNIRMAAEPRSHDDDDAVPVKSGPVALAPAPPPQPPSVGRRALGVVRTLRPHQWVKNVFVLAPVVFAKELTKVSVITGAIGAFFVFCLVASAVYTLNDLVDAPADRVHPVKRNRPIASGLLPLGAARVLLVALLVLALGGALLLPLAFLAVAVGYFAQNVAYSLALKKVAYLDVSCIAAGFVLRVLAGGFATETHVSGYMIACTAFLALFLGFGKRRHELGGANAQKQRAALGQYSPRALFWALAITGVASVGAYLAYTLDHDTRRFFQSEWLWLTTIHPLIGVLRFLWLVKTKPSAESPTQEMLRDTPSVLNVVVWIIEVIAIVYRLRPT